MIRKIYVGDSYSRKVTTPLITTDYNSYKIIWETKETEGVFKITAVREDGSYVVDYGEMDENGIATYIIATDMYSIEGNLKLFLAVVNKDSITTCREIKFVVEKGADKEVLAENNVDKTDALAQKIVEINETVFKNAYNTDKYGFSSVYVLEDGKDITVEDSIVTGLLAFDFSQYEAVAFPEGITEIRLPDGDGVTTFVANTVIMPTSLRKIGMSNFSNFVRFDDDYNIIESSVKVKVKEYVLNENLEEIGSYAFADNVYLEKINIPHSLRTIKQGVFQYSDKLEKVFIPATVTIIEDGNFTATVHKQENATKIYGYAGSEAEHYAKNENWLKEYQNTFVNMGSDYSTEIDNMKAYIDEQIGLALEGEYWWV